MIRSKAYVSTEEMGDQYCLIGPYKEACARTEVEEGPLGSEALNDAVTAVRNKGFRVGLLMQNFVKFYYMYIFFFVICRWLLAGGLWTGIRRLS